MTAGVQVFCRDRLSGIVIQTPRLHAELGIERELDRNLLDSKIRHWNAAGYVLEDACVLALFEISATSGSQGDRQDWQFDSAHLPRLRDINQIGALPPSPFQSLRNSRPGVYPIVDRLDHLFLLLKAGAEIIQLRIKSESISPEIQAQIREAVAIAREFPQSQLFINDYWQTAIEENAWGVHLGQEDLLTADLSAIQRSGLRLGVSSHSFWEVARALSVRPSYVACGPLFPTRAKAMPWIPQGIENLRYWVKLIPHPVIGIGGINASNLSQVRETGCASASVIQAIVSASDPALAYQDLQRQWRSTTPDQDEPIALARPTLALS